ncbi:hypothetical protein DPMN_031986 [Dreissena polymorpha]|uniref:Uncharacterized protein n=1 Tax=Dreissena polymorpha TaxID=45954 RepID=A0A9D4RJL7_DREPO|nr:hypothetical protein DPMN_031986 [Dreissena polymorpha]
MPPMTLLSELHPVEANAGLLKPIFARYGDKHNEGRILCLDERLLRQCRRH